jgi:hypothetical protein
MHAPPMLRQDELPSGVIAIRLSSTASMLSSTDDYPFDIGSEFLIAERRRRSYT